MVLKYILFLKLHFCRFMHSLGKNEKYSYVRNAYGDITKEMAFRVTRIVTLKNYSRACFASYLKTSMCNRAINQSKEEIIAVKTHLTNAVAKRNSVLPGFEP